jgi:hypothetical protein
VALALALAGFIATDQVPEEIIGAGAFGRLVDGSMLAAACHALLKRLLDYRRLQSTNSLEAPAISRAAQRLKATARRTHADLASTAAPPTRAFEPQEYVRIQHPLTLRRLDHGSEI